MAARIHFKIRPFFLHSFVFFLSLASISLADTQSWHPLIERFSKLAEYQQRARLQNWAIRLQPTTTSYECTKCQGAAKATIEFLELDTHQTYSSFFNAYLQSRKEFCASIVSVTGRSGCIETRPVSQHLLQGIRSTQIVENNKEIEYLLVGKEGEGQTNVYSINITSQSEADIKAQDERLFLWHLARAIGYR